MDRKINKPPSKIMYSIKSSIYLGNNLLICEIETYNHNLIIIS